MLADNPRYLPFFLIFQFNRRLKVPAGQLLIKFKSKQQTRDIEKNDITQAYHIRSSNFTFSLEASHKFCPIHHYWWSNDPSCPDVTSLCRNCIISVKLRPLQGGKYPNGIYAGRVKVRSRSALRPSLNSRCFDALCPCMAK